MRFVKLAALAMIIAVFAPVPAWPKSALEKSEASVGGQVGNYRLMTQDREFIAFNSFKGRPLLLTFMYTHCPGPCQMISASIQNIQDEISKDLAQELITISVTIDTVTDSPAVLKEFGEQFTDNFDNWKFAWVDRATLENMVADLGFRYDKKVGDQMDHMNRLTLIGPDGTVARHFYGTNYDVKEVEDAIRTVVEGRSFADSMSNSFSRALLYCSDYDPATGTYKIDYWFIVSSLLQYLLVVVTLAYIFRERLVDYVPRFLRHGKKQ